MSTDLGRWLTELGLGGHAATLAANAVDWDVLPDLSEKDLESLGLPLGDRKRLLRAIAALDGRQPAAVVRRPADGAERRQITVMFVDLVGSTPLSERLDPEDMRELLRTFHGLCAAAIAVRGGHIARYMGDGLLVYFGYPQAHEDDAARAVHAGLGIVAALTAANEDLERAHGARLRVRIGIHTGLVVVGEVGAGPTRDKDAVTGETPNIASRLQAEAEPDTVVIGAATQRLVEGLFALEDLGAHHLKGVTNAMRLYRALDQSDTVDRFDMRARRGLTPLVGREAELDMLRRRWTQARDGEMRSILLVGDAGIGKSRVMRALRDGLADESHEVVALFCSPYHVASALWPMLDWFRRALRLDAKDEPSAARQALAEVAASLDLDLDEAMPLLQAFLEIPGNERHASSDTSAPAFKRQLLDLLVKALAALARRQPVLLLVEDAHWIDPSTLELLHQAQEQLTQARLMLLITARPEFRPGWSYPQFLQINLDRLSRRDRTAMVERLTGNRPLPDFVLEEIVTKTDGIPLFVEELTKAVLEGDMLRNAGGRYELAGPFQTIAIPDTLQGSLMARLDRLDPEARDVAQLGATIGREFPRKLLARLADRSDEALDAALARLIEAEIVVLASGTSSAGRSHVFRHALIQETAYQSLLLARRRQHHAAIAAALAVDFPDVASMQPEMIAQHWTSAQRPDEAIDWWRRAGDRAFGRSAYVEACAHFQRGIELGWSQSGNDSSRSRRVLPLLMARGDAEFRAAMPAAQPTFRECVTIARRESLPETMVSAALKFATSELFLGAASCASVVVLEEALAALGSEETIGRCRILSRLAKTLLSTGATERGHEVLRQARAMTNRLNDRPSLFEVLVSDLMPNGAPPPVGEQIAERRRALALIGEIAEEIDLTGKVEVFGRSIVAYLEIGDVGDFERMVLAVQRQADLTRSGFDAWVAANSLAMRAMIHGAFRDAERSALDALNALKGGALDFPLGVYGMQMFTIRREQGRLAEVAPLVKRFVSEKPDEAVWRPGLMLIASDLGFEAQARKSFEVMAQSAFSLPLDSKRTITLAYLTEVCTRLGDAARAERLYELLLPYRELAVVVPTLTLCCGAAARFLGMLSATMHDWGSAEAHFEAALAFDERMKAWPWLAHSRFEYACMLLARGQPRDMVRAGELKASALAAAERMEMARLRQRIVGSA